MHYKIITCPQREDRIIKKLNHFLCKCQVPHEIVVWMCPLQIIVFAKPVCIMKLVQLMSKKDKL